MRIVIQSDAHSWGGNEKWLLLVAQALTARNHDVLISCKPGTPVARSAAAAGLRVSHARPAGDADLISTLRFAAMLRRESPDVLLLSNFRRTLTAGWAAHRAEVPRVVERLSLERRLPHKWKYRYAFSRYVDALLVNSETIRDRWLESAPWFPADHVHVVYNAVSRPSGGSTIRAELGIAPSARVIAAAGTLEPRKGFDLLLSAFARLRAEDVHLLIAGAGHEEKALRHLSNTLGLSQRVHWLGFRDDLPSILLGADIFAHASRREGMANVMLEAMAAECLIVATEVSGVREALGARPGRPQVGWIVPPNDAPALVRALEDALMVAQRNHGAVEEQRAEMRYRVDNWFTVEQMIAAVENILIPQS